MKWMLLIAALAVAGCAEGSTLPFAVEHDDSDHCEAPRSNEEAQDCRDQERRHEAVKQAVLAVATGLGGAGQALIDHSAAAAPPPRAPISCVSQIAGSTVYTSCN